MNKRTILISAIAFILIIIPFNISFSASLGSSNVLHFDPINPCYEKGRNLCSGPSFSFDYFDVNSLDEAKEKINKEYPNVCKGEYIEIDSRYFRCKGKFDSELYYQIKLEKAVALSLTTNAFAKIHDYIFYFIKVQDVNILIKINDSIKTISPAFISLSIYYPTLNLDSFWYLTSLLLLFTLIPNILLYFISVIFKKQSTLYILKGINISIGLFIYTAIVWYVANYIVLLYSKKIIGFDFSQIINIYTEYLVPFDSISIDDFRTMSVNKSIINLLEKQIDLMNLLKLIISMPILYIFALILLRTVILHLY